MQIRGIIFDLDNTLVLSKLNFEQIRHDIRCPKGADILDFISTLPARERSVAEQKVREHELDDAQHATWLPGAKRYVDLLAKANIPMAIVTRNYSAAADVKMQRNRIPIPLLLTREDAPAKPNPTALLQIAKHWRIDHPEIMYIGDYKYDVDAANNAGMLSCLYCPGALPSYSGDADIVISHFDELILKQRLTSQ
ncbi:HAD family hydrolase [Motilimonas pumila]|uniref:HAD family hydrolase n=1 Tax=Motilimonas pumila TaxID=2303987 RepID=A0A418YFN8_9GAMM|nr:HAD-IA family hydrolase [Motilimonas pumila]RJG48158.1 HAD family hydrolase [Motilimonas pumila]